MKFQCHFSSKSGPRLGFTLVELSVVLATLAVLAALLYPALAATHPDSQAFQCLNNQRQIMLAWQMYATDNHDVLPPNDWYSGNGSPVAFYERAAFRLELAGRGNGSSSRQYQPPILTFRSTRFIRPWPSTIIVSEPIIVRLIPAW